MRFSNALRVRRLATGILIALLFLVPIVYVILISLESPAQFGAHPLQPPVPPSIGNFGSAWQQGDLGPEIVNTIIYAVVAAGISTGLSLLIAFPVARRLVRFSSSLYQWFVVGLALPISYIPLFIEARDLGLYNNRIGYILLHVEPGLPLGVILLTAFVSGIPQELDEAAWLDGASYPRYILSFVAPLAWPSMVITFLYSMLLVWNDIIGPVVFLANPSLFPVARGVFSFYSSNESAYTLLGAAVMIVSAPVALLFVVSQKQLLRATMGLR
ncbi:MAG: carbohydrate ABC transporter permease [Acidimicrobiales bacterium]